MDAVLDKMLERVRALLALAENEGATPAEAELATMRAAEIMAKFKIDAAMLAAKADTREVPCDKKITFADPYANQHMVLYYGILKAFGGAAIVLNTARRSGVPHTCTLHVYGFEADLMAVDILYTSLLLQGINQSRVVPPFEHARSWRVSFWAGFTGQIHERLTAAHKKAEESTDTPGTAIVLRDRAAAVSASLSKDYANVAKRRASTVRSRHGYETGKEAGTRANLHNQTQTGGSRKVAIG